MQTSFPLVYAEKAIEPVIKFDKPVYGPFDPVYIEVTYPPANVDPQVQDKLEVKIFKSSGVSQPLVLYEAKPGFIYGWWQYQYHTDTGIFYSNIWLTPEPPEWEGSLQVQKDDVLTVEFKTKDNMIFTAKADINYNLGDVRFNKDAFSSRETVEVIVWDIDRNNNPNMVNTLPVIVWSTTDRTGLMVTLREENANSDTFHAFLTLTRSEASSGNRLLVSDGDTITARYTDNTRLPTDELTPKGSKTFAVREVFASALVGDCILCPPLERAYTSDLMIFSTIDKVPRVLAYYDQLKVGDTAIIRTKITEPLNRNIPFAYLVQIKNSDDVVVSLSWIRAELKANETMTIDSTWIPESPDTYTIENFVWSDIDNPDPLSPTRTTEVKVLPGSDKEKTLLWIDTYPEYAVQSLGNNVIKGHLFGPASMRLPNHEIMIYLESMRIADDTGWFYDQKVGSTTTDENGCFYFPLLEYNMKEVYNDFTESKNLNSNMSAIVTLSLEFDGNTVYHMSNAKSRIYYNPESLGGSSPALQAYLVNGTHSISEISITPGSEIGLQLWVNNHNNTGIVELGAKNLPCGVDAKFEPHILSFQDELQKLSTITLTSGDAKSGNYIIQIVTRNNPTKLQLSPDPTKDPTTLQPSQDIILTKDLETELLGLQLRIN